MVDWFIIIWFVKLLASGKSLFWYLNQKAANRKEAYDFYLHFIYLIDVFFHLKFDFACLHY